MKTKLAITCLVLGSIMTPIYSYASDDVNVDWGQPGTFRSGSAITTKIKAKLTLSTCQASQKFRVDTDANGIRLGRAEPSPVRPERSIRPWRSAKDMAGVNTVKDNLKVEKPA